jgi:hypothetical protein
LWNKILSRKTSPFPSNLNCITFVKSTGEKEDNGMSALAHPVVGTFNKTDVSTGPGLIRKTLSEVEFAVQKSRCKSLMAETF